MGTILVKWTKWSCLLLLIVVWYSLGMTPESKELVKNNPTINPVGLSIYGDKFKKFSRLGEINDLIPSFKDWYYQKKMANDKETLTNILRTFNSEVCEPQERVFHPKTSTMRLWRNKWDLDMIEQMREINHEVTDKKIIRQLVQVRNSDIPEVELEHGVKTLGAELLNDAMQMLTDDQQLEDIYDSEELMKRRSYILNVFSHATKLVHGKAALMLKASAEKRDTASFLMSLLSRATAGKVSDEEINVLKSAYAPKQDAQQQV